MSEPETPATPEAIDDEQLPEDLRPDDNPLAAGLEPGETVEGLLTDGKGDEQDEDGDDGAS
jgi:hypothetical protein